MELNQFFKNAKEHGQNNWWRYFLVLLFAAIGYVIGQIPITIVLFKAMMEGKVSINAVEQNRSSELLNPDLLGIDKNLFLLLILLTFVFCLAGFWFSLKLLMKKSIQSMINGFGKIRFERIFFAFFIWAILLMSAVIFSYLTEKENFIWQFDSGKFLILFIVSLIFIPVQTTTEELLFRGFLMQGIQQLTRSAGAALIVSSLLFGCMHLMNPEVEKHGWLLMLPYYSGFGLFLGLIAIIDEGLEIPIGVHAANNLMMSLTVTSESSVLQTDAILKSKSESLAAEFSTWIIIVTLFSIILWIRYQWKSIKWKA